MPDKLAEAAELIQSVLERDGRPCFTCSFQAEDVVLLDMLRRVRPDIPVLFLETGYHFAETYAYRDRLAREWGLNLVNVMPALSREAHEAANGKLYQSEPDRCCKLRKVEPLLAALNDYEIWFTGLRREQSPTRAGLQPVETQTLPNGKELVKVSPLAFWTWKEVWSYLKVNEIPHLPLYDQGYLSIGCQPCTQLPLDADNPRSGRWAGQKLECGIHTFNVVR
ncbi:MAG TPA: phosphoadenylyl-sulfate reductase [Bryobacteraceae bacterium]|nr:phosphoadenylyl-sulfate reductase [Bryobacteraceae bacterium]HOQ47056.1 phosphoadenylyl-sulfate reductase [Bryobacteraceae bacterium]HPQ16201.1 phosphoadenylyl-sulfate reductase [Bryobacteraceae bacterium]HPU71071.1 phosphoadenylyl-sulfate reductase [Bryobacteraceae bacterium]